MAATAVVCAYSPVGRAALEGVIGTGIGVKALFTYPQATDEQWFEAPAALAERHGIPIFMEPAFNTDAVFERIRALAPDLLLSFYFREMIQARFLEIPKLGAYNLHGSLLPKYRGRAPINWVLVKGEPETGVTLHAMTPKPDDGAIIGQVRLPIHWDDTALSLTLRSAEASRDLVKDLVPKLVDGTAPRLDQKTLGPSTYFGGRKPEDSRLDFAMTTQEAFNQLRAVADPWPNAFLRTEFGEVRIPWALPSEAPCPTGQFRVTEPGVLIGFQDGALRIVALRKNGLRSEDHDDHAAWLRSLGLPESR